MDGEWNQGRLENSNQTTNEATARNRSNHTSVSEDREGRTGTAGTHEGARFNGPVRPIFYEYSLDHDSTIKPTTRISIGNSLSIEPRIDDNHSTSSREFIATNIVRLPTMDDSTTSDGLSVSFTINGSPIISPDRRESTEIQTMRYLPARQPPYHRLSSEETERLLQVWTIRSSNS